MQIIGIDLSGPGSPEHTAVAQFLVQPDGLSFQSITIGADDAAIADLVPPSSCVVGIDAPLSYSPTGRSRVSDSILRGKATAAGLTPGAVMAPSAPRMAYLTLRGVALTRLLQSLHSSIRIVEVHPTAALAFRGAPIDAVRTFKRSADARASLANWLRSNGLRGIHASLQDSDHAIAACAAALVAWKWEMHEPVWLHQAEPPIHPFDFAC